MSARRILCYLWAAPTTLSGLLFLPLALLSRGAAQIVDGVLEIHGGAVAWLLRHAVPLRGGALALTLGHVVLGLNPATLDVTRPHERVHVRQCERWGAFFLPAYLLASLIARLHGGHFYRDNIFEREAYQRTP
jgi:hypothetical protein